MKAVIVEDFIGPDGLVYGDLSDPVPGGRQVLVKVRACGVCRRDVLVSRGPAWRGLHSPLVLGHEIAGDVVGLGPEARGFRLGDRVASTQREYVCGCCTMCRTDRETLCPDLRFLGQQSLGGYAELVVVNDDNLVGLPDDIDYAAGAIIGCPVGTAYNAVCDTGRVKPAEFVLVTGMGGVGTHAVQIAKSAGAIVIAVTRSADKDRNLRDLGASHVIVSSKGEFADAVRKITNGAGVALAIDTVGGAVFHQVRKSVALGGRIVLVGEIMGTPIELDIASIYRRGLEIRSAVSTSRRQLEMAIRLVQHGAVKPQVAATMPLSAAAEAHRVVENGGLPGRVVLIP